MGQRDPIVYDLDGRQLWQYGGRQHNVAGMSYPVRCTKCNRVYDLGRLTEKTDRRR